MKRLIKKLICRHKGHLWLREEVISFPHSSAYLTVCGRCDKGREFLKAARAQAAIFKAQTKG